MTNGKNPPYFWFWIIKIVGWIFHSKRFRVGQSFRSAPWESPIGTGAIFAPPKGGFSISNSEFAPESHSGWKTILSYWVLVTLKVSYPIKLNCSETNGTKLVLSQRGLISNVYTLLGEPLGSSKTCFIFVGNGRQHFLDNGYKTP